MASSGAQLTELERAIETLVENFFKYSKGKNDKLNKKEFKTMLHAQFNNILTNTTDEEATDNMIAQLDKNKDGKITFDEYWELVGGMAIKLEEVKARNL